ncbi:MAG: tetratricopeptide repeat protein [bacterium]|nr:tetratricopeptide repeat protein [bacterium]
MLKGLLKSSEDKIREKVEEHMTEGLKNLRENFFNRAMIEFDKAMALNKDEVYPRIKKELDEAAATGQIEAALSLGMNLIKGNHGDYELANKLGNFARELKNYPQAESLYKLALKAKKDYQPAFYNLAASMARVDKYDDAVQSALSMFDGIDDYIYPDFVGASKLVETMTQRITEEKEAARTERLQELELLKEQKESQGFAVEAKDLDFEIRKIKEAPKAAQPEDLIDEFKRLVEEDAANAKDHIYNLAVYALMEDKLGEVDEALTRISVSDFEYVDLLKAIVLAKRNDLEGAITLLNRLLGENEFNRLYNVNLGLMYKRQGKRFVMAKYLIKTAALLEKSGGIYSMKELVRMAHDAYDNGSFKKALNFYQIASSEIPDPKLWERLGTLYIQMKKYDDAVSAFRTLKDLEPNSSAADEKLKEIHDYYFEKGASLLEDRKFKPASDYFRKALNVLRLPETVKTAAIVFGQLKQHDEEEKLLEEYNGLLKAEKDKEVEVERQKLISEAKAWMAKKNYLKAIQAYESALRKKVDKSVFLQLAALYKGLKKTNELHDLVARWEKMVEHEEKMKQFEKEKERQMNA